MIKQVPDDSCRKCGGMLLEHSICAQCREPNQFICRICGTMTIQQYHTACFNKTRLIEEFLTPEAY